MLEQMKPILSVYLNKVKEAGRELAKEGRLSEETHKKYVLRLYLSEQLKR